MRGPQRAVSLDDDVSVLVGRYSTPSATVRDRSAV
jgi:hypothetical protein